MFTAEMSDKLQNPPAANPAGDTAGKPQLKGNPGILDMNRYIIANISDGIILYYTALAYYNRETLKNDQVVSLHSENRQICTHTVG